MRRRQLFEFNESKWFPQLLRNYETDYLETLFRRTWIYAGIVPALAGFLRRCGTRSIVDLCSGGGGPLPALVGPLFEELGEIQVTLTDRYPNRRAFERLAAASHGRIAFRLDPVDALHPPRGLEGVRTLFDAFHHFPPPRARRILAEAVRDRAPIAIFEAPNRRWPFVLASILTPLFVLMLTPSARPFRWSRLLYTYLVPVLPVVIGWDGLVSHLRAYLVSELETMTCEVGGPGYEWTVEEIRSGPARITTVLGWPV